VADQDFNFRPPVERRKPKQFEPPPWEREAFDELSRAKTAQQEAAEAAEAAAAEELAAESAVVAPPASAEPPARIETERPAAISSPETPAEASAPAKGAVSEAELTEMMAGLRAEEPTSTRTYSRVAIALSVFTGLVGIVMLVWAMAMLVSSNARGAGRVGIVSGSIVAVFGALFIGLSMWVAVRTLRQRGVL
jgi:hypothetical protein